MAAAFRRALILKYKESLDWDNTKDLKREPTKDLKREMTNSRKEFNIDLEIQKKYGHLSSFKKKINSNTMSSYDNRDDKNKS